MMTSRGVECLSFIEDRGVAKSGGAEPRARARQVRNRESPTRCWRRRRHEAHRTEFARPPLASAAAASASPSSPSSDRVASVDEARPRRCAAVGGAKCGGMCNIDEFAFSRKVAACEVARLATMSNFVSQNNVIRCDLITVPQLVGHDQQPVHGDRDKRAEVPQ